MVEGGRTELYQALCRALSGRAGPADWGALEPDDWAALVQLARSEWVAPLLHARFKASGWPPEAPQAAQQGLAKAYYAAAAQNTLFFDELARASAALAQAGVRPVLLKGGMLALSVYPDASLRPMGDLDLLVRRSELDRAFEVMISLGYRRERTAGRPELWPGLDRWNNYEANFMRAGVPIELHWSLIGGQASHLCPDMDWFWEQTRTLELVSGPDWVGERLLALTPTASLMFQGAHLSLKHDESDRRLAWYHDMHLCLVQWGDRLDVDLLLARAREFRWGAAIADAVSGCYERFDTEAPPRLVAGLEALRHEESTALLRQRAIASPTRLQRAWSRLAQLNWRARWLVVMSQIFPHPTFMRWRYRPRPGWLLPLYYPYRWLDITADSVRTLISSARRRAG